MALDTEPDGQAQRVPAWCICTRQDPILSVDDSLAWGICPSQVASDRAVVNTHHGGNLSLRHVGVLGQLSDRPWAERSPRPFGGKRESGAGGKGRTYGLTRPSASEANRRFDCSMVAFVLIGRPEIRESRTSRSREVRDW